MLGAIYGDMAGSVYEFHNTYDYDFRLMGKNVFPTDDSYMTLAVAEALMHTYGKDDHTIQKELVHTMQSMGRKYPHGGYGGMFARWLRQKEPEPYGSFGNGSAMRVSPAGWLYQTMAETLHAAELSASVTHNHPEGIKGAKAIAACIFLARMKVSKDEILAYITNVFDYHFNFKLDQIRGMYGFDATCPGSVPQAIRAFYEGKNFEDVIRLAVSLGGDSDTITCMAGSIAEAYYGMHEKEKKQVMDHLDPYCRSILGKYHGFYKKHSGEPTEKADTLFLQADATACLNERLAEEIDWYNPEKKENEAALLKAMSDFMVYDARMYVPVTNSKGFAMVEEEAKDGNEANVFVYTGMDKMTACRETYTDTMRMDLRSVIEAVLIESDREVGVFINPSHGLILSTEDLYKLLSMQKEQYHDEMDVRHPFHAEILHNTVLIEQIRNFAEAHLKNVKRIWFAEDEEHTPVFLLDVQDEEERRQFNVFMHTLYGPHLRFCSAIRHRVDQHHGTLIFEERHSDS